MTHNKHVEYKRIVKGARVAVLCVHGIMGTPNHFRDLVPLIPDNFSVYNIVIDGHCGTVKDFGTSSMKRWEDCVANAVSELLRDHEEIYVLAHSMGTLLTIEQGMKEPRISRYFCLSVPIKVGVRARMFNIARKVYFKRIPENDIVTLSGRECYGIADTKNIFMYLTWIPRFLELFKKIDQIRKSLGSFNTPCTAYQSRLDELVSPKSIKILENESNMRVVELEKSTHIYYDRDEMEYLKKEFLKFLT